MSPEHIKGRGLDYPWGSQRTGFLWLCLLDTGRERWVISHFPAGRIVCRVRIKGCIDAKLNEHVYLDSFFYTLRFASSWSSPLWNQILMWLHQISDCQKGVLCNFAFLLIVFQLGKEDRSEFQKQESWRWEGFPSVYPPNFYWMVYLKTLLG